MQIYSDKTLKILKKPLAIELDKVYFNYGDYNALKNISFKLSKGDFLYIIGPNGAGKSTLVKILTNIVKPDNGTYNIYSNKLGYLPQSLNTKTDFPITVAEVIYTGFLKQSIFISKEHKNTINTWLEKMDLIGYYNEPMSSLSGGQQQRVLLIRALISNPDILILDEPTSALDPEFRKEFYKIINKLNKEGTTIIFITHDVDELIKGDKLIMQIDREIQFFGLASDFNSKIGDHYHV